MQRHCSRSVNGMKEIQKRLSNWTGVALSTSLIAVAIVAILVAIFVKNKWVKAAVLAYEILP